MNSKDRPLVSILIVTYNCIDDIDMCLKSIENQTYRNFEIIVIDNASSDGTPSRVRRNFPSVNLITSEINLGYGGGNVLGLKYTQGEYVTISNPDVVADENWLSELINGAERYPEVGIIASNTLNYYDPEVVNALGNEVHFTGLVFCRGLGKRFKSGSREKYIIAPSGAAFMMRRAMIEDIGFMERARILVLVIDSSAPLKYYTTSTPIHIFTILTLGVLALAYFREKFAVKLASLRAMFKSFQSKKVISGLKFFSLFFPWYVYCLSFIIWIEVHPDFNMTLVDQVGLIPWYFYPLSARARYTLHLFEA